MKNPIKRIINILKENLMEQNEADPELVDEFFKSLDENKSD